MLASFDFYFCRLFGFALVFCNVTGLFLQIIMSLILHSGLSWGEGQKLTRLYPFLVIWGIWILGCSHVWRTLGNHRDLACISLICQKPKTNPNQRNFSSRKSNTELGVLTTAIHLRISLQCLYLLSCLAFKDNHTWLSQEFKRPQTHHFHSFFYLWTHSFIQEMLIEHLLCTQHFSWSWACSCKPAHRVPADRRNERTKFWLHNQFRH